jgi:aryl-alcohol dehydrogenase-like predicted oxidoreductase
MTSSWSPSSATTSKGPRTGPRRPSRAASSAALRTLRADTLDVALLHSCSVETLQRGEVIAALHAARDTGNIRVAGHSGESEALDSAVRSGHFAAFETSVNLVDQWSLTRILPAAQGHGVIAKRPLANAPWRFEERPVGHYAEAYWERVRTLALTPADGDWVGTAVRFSAHAPGVSSAIVGTASPEHIQAAASAVGRGPLPAEELARWRDAWASRVHAWPSEL